MKLLFVTGLYTKKIVYGVAKEWSNWKIDAFCCNVYILSENYKSITHDTLLQVSKKLDKNLLICRG